MVAQVRAHYYNDANTIEPTTGFVSALRAILGTNIVCADFLADAATTEVIDYQPVRGRSFKRVWSMLDNSAAAETLPDLFHQVSEPKRDEVPVHYLDIAGTPQPDEARIHGPRRATECLMAAMLGQQHVPDILDCLAQLSNDEVPTPPKLASAMLDLLPAERLAQPRLPMAGPVLQVRRLPAGDRRRACSMGSVDWEPDFEKRREHIYRNMLFGTSITEMTGIISRRTLYCSRDAAGEHSVIRFDIDDGNLPFIRAEHDFIDSGRCQICGAPEDLSAARAARTTPTRSFTGPTRRRRWKT